MRRLSLIGVGAGDPRLVTVEATAALAATDVFLVLRKRDDVADLDALRHELLARYASPGHRVVEIADPERNLADGARYGDSVDAWRDRRTELLGAALRRELDAGGTAALLVWGDPSLYDGSLRIASVLEAQAPWPLAVEVIPGVSSLHLLTARHRIPLNRVGAAVRLTTGRRLLESPPDAGCDVVVFLDSRCAFAELDGAGIDIYWGAYLGSDDEILVAGPLEQRRDEIVRLRAQARERKGWMFDTYLLRFRG